MSIANLPISLASSAYINLTIEPRGPGVSVFIASQMLV